MFFLLSDKHSQDITSSDAATILDAITIHNEQTKIAKESGGQTAGLYVEILSSRSKVFTVVMFLRY